MNIDSSRTTAASWVPFHSRTVWGNVMVAKESRPRQNLSPRSPDLESYALPTRVYIESYTRLHFPEEFSSIFTNMYMNNFIFREIVY